MNLSQLQQIKPDSIQIDFSSAENELGFKLCSGIRSLYSRTYGDTAESVLDLKEGLHTIPQGGRFDNWFSFNECEGPCEVTLDLPPSAGQAGEWIVRAFREWTGGNDFGRRMLIGTFFLNIGDICIVLNNDTNQVEWVDCGYGYFDVYEENPHGVMAGSIEEFLAFFR